jgi:hypothetical protein
MSAADDILNAARRVVGDKPVFLLAGASDLVNEKLRELPSRLTSLQDDYRDVPMKAAGNLVGQVFRANLKLGELYDDLTRRGEDVVAKMRGEPVYDDGDEPFVREPYLPEPVHHVAQPPAVPPTKTVVKKTPVKKAPATKKTPTAKKAAAKKAAAKKAETKKAATKKAATKQQPTKR